MFFTCYAEGKEKKHMSNFFCTSWGSWSPPPAFLPNSPCFSVAFDPSTHPPTTEQRYAAIDDCIKAGHVWRKSHFLKSFLPVCLEELVKVIIYSAA